MTRLKSFIKEIIGNYWRFDIDNSMHRKYMSFIDYLEDIKFLERRNSYSANSKDLWKKLNLDK